MFEKFFVFNSSQYSSTVIEKFFRSFYQVLTSYIYKVLWAFLLSLEQMKQIPQEPNILVNKNAWESAFVRGADITPSLP